jgi:hypothetical protein
MEHSRLLKVLFSLCSIALSGCSQTAGQETLSGGDSHELSGSDRRYLFGERGGERGRLVEPQERAARPRRGLQPRFAVPLTSIAGWRSTPAQLGLPRTRTITRTQLMEISSERLAKVPGLSVWNRAELRTSPLYGMPFEAESRPDRVSRSNRIQPAGNIARSSPSSTSPLPNARRIYRAEWPAKPKGSCYHQREKG